MRHCGLGQEEACWFQCWKTQLASFDWSDIGAIDVEMDGSVLKEKSSFKVLEFTFPSRLDWRSYITSIAKIAFKKLHIDLFYEVSFS